MIIIKHFYKRPHADQILVTFGLAIVLQEIIKYYFGANQIPTPAPEAFVGGTIGLVEEGDSITIDAEKVVIRFGQFPFQARN